MDAQATKVLLRFFMGLKDPRRHNVRHLFSDILTIAILAVMCKADDWIEVVAYAKGNLHRLETFLSLPKGIPSADTFRRVFARIDPEAFERCFMEWTRTLAEVTQGRVIPIDGKTLRRSFEHAWDKQAIHLVSAWSAHNEIVLGQLVTDSKSNEITAIPKLLDLLNVKDAIVTIDAMGCQKEIAQKIIEGGGDYVLAVKDNQPTLHQQVHSLMEEAKLEYAQSKGKVHSDWFDYFEQTNGGHGRIEIRRCFCTSHIEWIGEAAQWPGLASVAMVESHRIINGKTTVEYRCFISSLKDGNAQQVAQAVRAHWGIENGLHWRLDMTFREDESRLRKGHGAENFSRLRRIVLNKLKDAPEEEGRKSSLKVKRYRCSIDPQYLMDVLCS